jgi:hypothetical protein
VAGWVIAHEATGRDVGWRPLPAAGPVDSLVFHRRVVAREPVVVRHYLEATSDGVQVQHRVIRVPVTTVVNPHVTCYPCQQSGSQCVS